MRRTLAAAAATVLLTGCGTAVADAATTHTITVDGTGRTYHLYRPAERPYGVEAVMRDISGVWLVLVEPRTFSAES